MLASSFLTFFLFLYISSSNALESQIYNDWYADQIKGTLLPALEVRCDWLLPDAGIIKKSYTVICPSNCLDVTHCDRVKGSSPYPVNSPVCLSALHAGVISPAKGGAVEVSVAEGKAIYLGTTRNGVTSTAYGSYFASFTVKKSDVSCKPTLPPTAAPCVSSAILDLVFVCDSSLSVGKDDFQLQMKFIKDIIGLFNISPQQTRVGLTTFNSIAKTKFKLTDYSSKAAVLKAVDDVKFETGGTYVGKALWQVVWDMKFRTEPNIEKVVVVFTDGRSADSPRRPVDKLAAKGVELIAFGVGNVKESALLQIADEKKDNVYSVKDYSELKNYMGSIVMKICSFVGGKRR